MAKATKKDRVEVEVLPIYFDYVLNKSYPVIILVGGRNSGKSHFMQQLSVLNLNNRPEYKLLVVEDVETNIGEGVKAGIEERAEEFGLDRFFFSTKVPPEITHKITGNKVIFKGYHSEAQQKQVKSLNEITACWYEEGENITYQQFKALRMQLRGGEPEDRQLFITMNPIVSDGYINSEFFEKPPDKVLEYFPDGRPKVFERHIKVEITDDEEETEQVVLNCLVVVTTYRDNPYLTAEQKADIEELKHTNPDMYAMLGEGKFVKPEGTAFPEFSPAVHVCKPFEIPKHWRRWMSCDNGYADPFAWYWYAVSEDGQVFVYREYSRTRDSDKVYYTDQAEAVMSMSTHSKLEDGEVSQEIEKIDFIAMGLDAWNTHHRDQSGKSLLDYYYEGGLKYSPIKAVTDRKLRKATVHEYLKPYTGHDGRMTAKVQIFDTCTHLIETLPKLLSDEKDIEKVADSDIDNQYDSLGYGLIAYHIDKSKTPPADKSPLEKHKEKLAKRRTMAGRMGKRLS